MTVYILGAGPAGLAIAHGLADSGSSDFAVIERDTCLGGLAQTVGWPGVGSHDLGPHKIFTLNADLMARVESLLAPDEWLVRDKTSRIYMNGHFLPYPPSPFSLAKVFGLPTFSRMVLDYGLAKVAGLVARGEPRTFEDDLKSRLGAGLYDVLFKPIALKLWGDPATLDLKLSKGRVQTPSLVEVIARLLRLKTSSQFEALTFRYPVGGLGRVWQAIQDKTRERGRFLLGHAVVGFEFDDQRSRITAINCVEAKSGERVRLALGDDDFVASTLPLGLSIKLLKDHLPAEFVNLHQQVLTLNDLILVFLHVDRPSLLPESWVFVPDPKIAFHRLSEQESFDPGMTPNGSIVCCEIMSNETRNMSALPNEELIEWAKRGLADMGYRGFKTLNQRVIRLPQSYPVFHVGFEANLGRILASMDAIANFRTVGRQGAFNYIGTLDAMDVGYGFARWFSGSRQSSWQAERERTRQYPVLD
jgi:UDP-galactopyranose mutase